ATTGRPYSPPGPDQGVEVIALSDGEEAREKLGGLFGRIFDADAARRRERHAYGGRTPLMAAAERGHVATLRVLIDRGATVDLREEDGFTALAMSVAAGQVAAVRTLLDAGANPNRHTND